MKNNFEKNRTDNLFLSHNNCREFKYMYIVIYDLFAQVHVSQLFYQLNLRQSCVENYKKIKQNLSFYNEI